MQSQHRGLIRRRLWYSGHVQGVGFRFTTERVANRFAVGGWVRNLPDGRVEMVAEGEAGELDRFVTAVAEAMGRNIRGSDERDEPADGGFDGFRIKYD